MNAVWHHAATIGRPLNVLLSMRPLNIDDMSVPDRCTLWARLRNKLAVYARGHGFPPTFVWSREINLDGSGEHLHVLLHVPARHRAHFDDLVIGWLPGPAEMDIRTATQKMRITSNNKRRSAIDYVSKQMHPKAAYKRGLTRIAGGPIVGKRSGVTKNLDHRARAEFRDRRPKPVVVARPSVSKAA